MNVRYGYPLSSRPLTIQRSQQPSRASILGREVLGSYRYPTWLMPRALPRQNQARFGHATQHFQLSNQANVSDDALKRGGELLEGYLEALESQVPLRLDGQLVVDVRNDILTPHCLPGKNGKLDLKIPEVKGDLYRESLLHELIHAVAGYSNVGLMEGLAVSLDQQIQPENKMVFPAFGIDVDLWSKRLMERKTDLPLSKVFSARSFFADAAAGRSNETFTDNDVDSFKSYLQAASFTKWLIKNRGWDEFWKLYQSASLTGPNAKIIGPVLDSYEEQWRQDIQTLEAKTQSAETMIPFNDKKFRNLAKRLEQG